MEIENEKQVPSQVFQPKLNTSKIDLNQSMGQKYDVNALRVNRDNVFFDETEDNNVFVEQILKSFAANKDKIQSQNATKYREMNDPSYINAIYNNPVVGTVEYQANLKEALNDNKMLHAGTANDTAHRLSRIQNIKEAISAKDLLNHPEDLRNGIKTSIAMFEDQNLDGKQIIGNLDPYQYPALIAQSRLYAANKLSDMKETANIHRHTEMLTNIAHQLNSENAFNRSKAVAGRFENINLLKKTYKNTQSTVTQFPVINDIDITLNGDSIGTLLSIDELMTMEKSFDVLLSATFKVTSIYPLKNLKLYFGTLNTDAQSNISMNGISIPRLKLLKSVDEPLYYAQNATSSRFSSIQDKCNRFQFDSIKALPPFKRRSPEEVSSAISIKKQAVELFITNLLKAEQNVIDSVYTWYDIKSAAPSGNKTYPPHLAISAIDDKNSLLKSFNYSSPIVNMSPDNLVASFNYKLNDFYPKWLQYHKYLNEGVNNDNILLICYDRFNNDESVNLSIKVKVAHFSVYEDMTSYINQRLTVSKELSSIAYIKEKETEKTYKKITRGPEKLAHQISDAFNEGKYRRKSKYISN